MVGRLIDGHVTERVELEPWDAVEAETSYPVVEMMEDFNSETDSEYTSYWRDWVGAYFLVSAAVVLCFGVAFSASSCDMVVPACYARDLVLHMPSQGTILDYVGHHFSLGAFGRSRWRDCWPRYWKHFLSYSYILYFRLETCRGFERIDAFPCRPGILEMNGAESTI